MRRPIRQIAGVLVLCGGLSAAPMSGAPTTYDAPAIGLPAATADPNRTPTPDAPRLASVHNFRDVAGTGAGYPARGNHHVNKGHFYRSSALTPSDSDLATVNGLHPAAVFDLRSQSEIDAVPDRVPAGAEYVKIPILGDNPATVSPDVKTPEDANAFMQTMYRLLVNGSVERDGYKNLLAQFAELQGPVVFHCTAGKDRTGWASYLLLHIAGVDPDTSMTNYLLTNEYSKAANDALIAQLTASQGAAAAAVYAEMLRADPGYLNAAIDEANKDYGSVDKYLTDGLGLQQSTIEKLRPHSDLRLLMTPRW